MIPVPFDPFSVSNEVENTTKMNRTRRCVKIRITNQLTSRSKNFRLSNSDLDDSMFEKILENPAALDVLNFSPEIGEQSKPHKYKVQCLLKRENKEDIKFSEDDMGKTNIQDLVDFQKKDDNHSELIQLILQCSPVIVEKKLVPPPPAMSEAIQVVTDYGSIRKLARNLSLSPSIMRKTHLPTRCRIQKSVSFRELMIDEQDYVPEI